MSEHNIATMASKVLLLFFLLPQLGLCSDRLKFHLENLVDRNISACDDFYHHACSQHVDPNEFFMERVRKIFTDAVNKFTPESDKNTAITVSEYKFIYSMI